MKLKILILFIICTYTSCSQNRGPGYKIELFKNTDSWELAKAVSNEDEKEINRILFQKKIDVNFQEPKFQNTLLHLAIGNDKLVSVKALLNNNANFNIVNVSKRSAIHEAVYDIKSRKNSYKILELLISHGADVNKIRSNPNQNADTFGFCVPLCDASSDFACSILLLNHGANPYFKSGNTYSVWNNILLMGDIDDYIYVAKYMIVDKKMLIPDPITYSISGYPLTIISLLNKLDLTTDPPREKAKEEIIGYLKKINFPKKGVYKY